MSLESSIIYGYIIKDLTNPGFIRENRDRILDKDHQ